MKTMMTITLLISSSMCLMMNSWLMIWVMLEMNTFSFCFLVKTESKQKESTTEMSMKYFVIQSLSSALLLSSAILTKTMFYFVSSNIMSMSLMIKMAAAPFHKWFVQMVKKIGWKMSSLLMTWQKLAPIYLVIFLWKPTVFLFIILTAWIGTIMQMNKKAITEIMSYSSIFNLSWMLLSITISLKAMITFSVLYWSAVMIMMTLLFKSNIQSMEMEMMEQYSKFSYLMAITNLGGIPPSLGFLAKIMVVMESLKTKMLLMSTLLMVISSINMYIYLRMFNFMIIKKTNKTQIMSSSSKMMDKIMILSIILPILIWCV